MSGSLELVFWCLYGDEAAESVGYQGVGLGPRAGLALALHESLQAAEPPESVLVG